MPRLASLSDGIEGKNLLPLLLYCGVFSCFVRPNRLCLVLVVQLLIVLQVVVFFFECSELASRSWDNGRCISSVGWLSLSSVVLLVRRMRIPVVCAQMGYATPLMSAG